MRWFPIAARGRWGVPLAAVALLGLVGCGGGVGTVTGKVSYKGKLLRGGNITFASTEGKPTISGPIKEDGSYTLEKVPVGAVKVCVETKSLDPRGQSPAARAGFNPYPKEKPEGSYTPPSPANDAKRFVAIPPAYAELETTTLTYKVQSGTQEHDIQLD